MGFLNESSRGPQIYLEVTETGKLLRPLLPRPQSVWCHKIQEVKTMGPAGQPVTIRKFQYETCTATGRNGIGCLLCNSQDPLWHLLTNEEQTNRKGQRVDFPKAPIHLLPVYDHSLNDVVVMKGGNQIYEEMDKWYESQKSNLQDQDLRRCDWRISKTGALKKTKYAGVRLDVSFFEMTPDLLEKAKNVMARALSDRAPTAPDLLMKIIKGDTGTTELPESAAVPSLTAPALTPPLALPQVAMPDLPKVAVPEPVMVHVEAAPGQAASRDELDVFSSWVSTQKEFNGMNAVDNLLPVLKKFIGHCDYSHLSAKQLDDLKVHLQAQLQTMRAKK